MKKINAKFTAIVVAVLIVIACFGFLVCCTGCSKLPKPLDLGSISGRWCHVGDTTRHFYIDSATSTTAVVRYPTRINAPLGTYMRFVYTLKVTARTVELTYPMALGRYRLYQVGGKWRGILYLNIKDSTDELIEVMQLDNYRNQPGPDVVAPL
jgi:hypothetical protein